MRFKARFVAGVSVALIILGVPSLAAARANWTLQPIPQSTTPSGTLSDVACIGTTFCEGVGQYVSPAGAGVPLIERWNGTSWAVQVPAGPAGARSSSLSGIACFSSSACEAVGSYVTGGGATVPLAEGWNGTGWAVQSVPGPAGGSLGELARISCSSLTNTCEAVGFSGPVSSSGYQAFAEQWNGTSWSVQTVPVPSGASSSGLSDVSCVYYGSCEAVGSYQTSGHADRPLAEAWNGSHWTTQLPPLPSGAARAALAGVSCLDAGSCEVVGGSNTAANVQTAFAERLTGSTWTHQSIPVPAGATGSELGAIACVSTSSCEAVGTYQPSAGPQAPLAVKFNGSVWALQTVARPAGGQPVLTAVACTGATACTAVGVINTGDLERTIAERFNGTSWSLQTTVDPNGVPRNLLAGISCVSSTSCTAVGTRQTSSTHTLPLAQRWNGTTWSTQTVPSPTPDAQLSGVACPSLSICEAVGSSRIPSSELPDPVIERFAGSSWATQSVTPPSGYAHEQLDAISCPTTTSCWAVGTAYASTAPHPVVERFNGVSWAGGILPEPTGTRQVSLTGVSCTAGSCMASGVYVTSAGAQHAFAEHFDGTHWSVLSVPAPGASATTSLAAVSCRSSTVCTAVGGYTRTDFFLFTPLVEHWNGTSWAIQPVSVPSGAEGAELKSVSCLATGCHAVGITQPNGSSSIPLAEYWDGTRWTQQSITSPPDPGSFASLNGVSCVATHTCEAAGDVQGATQGDRALVETGG